MYPSAAHDASIRKLQRLPLPCYISLNHGGESALGRAVSNALREVVRRVLEHNLTRANLRRREDRLRLTRRPRHKLESLYPLADDQKLVLHRLPIGSRPRHSHERAAIGTH